MRGKLYVENSLPLFVTKHPGNVASEAGGGPQEIFAEGKKCKSALGRSLEHYPNTPLHCF